jgi:hypothetical protein
LIPKKQNYVPYVVKLVGLDRMFYLFCHRYKKKL